MTLHIAVPVSGLVYSLSYIPYARDLFSPELRVPKCSWKGKERWGTSSLAVESAAPDGTVTPEVATVTSHMGSHAGKATLDYQLIMLVALNSPCAIDLLPKIEEIFNHCQL
jgi:hypothetical protein